MLDSRMDPALAKGLLRGAPDPLRSEFRLRYSMLLNIMRAEGAEPEQLLRSSFRQFQAERDLPQLQAKACPACTPRQRLLPAAVSLPWAP